MFIGGLSALLLQSLHPLAMAGVDQHSGFRGDPWGRLARTSHFLAVTTFGSAADAEAEIAQVRAVHRRVRGRAPDGRAYAASDPHLLSWVHVAEVEMFLRAYQRSRRRPAEAGGGRRVRRPVRRRRQGAGRGRRADDHRRAAGRSRGLPPRAARAPRRPGRRPATCSPARRCRGRCAGCTCRWPVRPWPCCRAGPGGRCACRGCR